jgi:hypothetical protein
LGNIETFEMDYQFAAILSQKYQAFPAVVALNEGLPIFHFLF